MHDNGKIHVVHITQYLEIGGLESFIVEFCRKLDKNVFTVSVLCLNGYDELYSKYLGECGVDIHLIKKRSKYDFLFLWRAAALLKAIDADVVHSHGGCFLYSSIIGRLAGVKGHVYTVHGMPVITGMQARFEEYLACAITDRIVAVSDEIAADLKQRQRNATNKIDVIINGIDSDRYKPVNDEKFIAARKTSLGLPINKKIIGTVGRLETVKNYPLLLNAFAELIAAGVHNCHLVLVGSGVEDGRLNELAVNLGIAENISFLGVQYDLHRIYPLFDVFVLPSLTEGTSLSLLEAQSCGIPAVVTDVGGNSRVIKHGTNGFLSPSCDQESMTAHLEYCLSNEADMTTMKKAARAEILNRFNLGAVLNLYQSLYCRLAAPDYLPGIIVCRSEYDISSS